MVKGPLDDVRVLDLDRARDKARAALVALSDGRDPRRSSTGETVADLAAQYLELRRPPAIKQAAAAR